MRVRCSWIARLAGGWQVRQLEGRAAHAYKAQRGVHHSVDHARQCFRGQRRVRVVQVRPEMRQHCDEQTAARLLHQIREK